MYGRSIIYKIGHRQLQVSPIQPKSSQLEQIQVLTTIGFLREYFRQMSLFLTQQLHRPENIRLLCKEK